MSPGGPGERQSASTDAERLEALLHSLGATDLEIRQAARRGRIGALAIELTLRNGGMPVSAEEAAPRLGGADAFFRTWQALGFPAPDPVETRVPSRLVETLPGLSVGMETYLGEGAMLGILRVIGSGMARLAQALVDAFRVGFEAPQLAAGTEYSRILGTYVDVTRDSMPALEELVCTVLRAHLVRVAAGTWTLDEERAAARHDLFVGFADLVGYTALSRTLSPAELAALLDTFERTVTEIVSAAGGQVVKLIGDGAMFVAENAVQGCRIAFALIEQLAAHDSLPPVRIGCDFGAVISQYGDYFGDVVNLAARLAALAPPAGLVASAEVAAACGAVFSVEPLPPQAIKGLPVPPASYTVRPASHPR